MKKSLAIVLLALAIQPAHAAGPTPADSPSEQSVRRLLAATGSPKLVDRMMEQMDSAMRSGIAQGLGNRPVTPAQQAIIDDMRTKMVAIFKEQMDWKVIEPTIVGVYQKTFTQKEVNGMLAFYESDIGKAVTAKMPAAVTSSMQAMQSRMGALTPKLQDLMRDTAAKLKAAEQSPAGPDAPGVKEPKP